MRAERTRQSCDAVFLHTGWRTAGTWLWSCFRASPQVMGFYEPLHEQLETLLPRSLSALYTEGWDSGHPDLDAPYFNEYLPLLDRKRGGVAGYRAAFSQDSFFQPSPPQSAALSAYLGGLIGHAAAQGQCAVLKFCRSLGRADWMMHTFPRALHVAVVTHPVSQWSSAWRQLTIQSNPYFVTMPFAVLARNRLHPRVAAVLERLKVVLPGRAEDSPAHIRASSPEACYRGFLAHWLLGMLAVPAGIPLIVNTDMLRLSAQYHQTVEQRLVRLSGLPLHLTDVQPMRLAESGAGQLGIDRRTVLACHRDAQAALLDDTDRHQADAARWSQISALLSFADLIGSEGAAALHATAFDQLSDWSESLAEMDRLRNRPVPGTASPHPGRVARCGIDSRSRRDPRLDLLDRDGAAARLRRLAAPAWPAYRVGP